MSMTIWLLGILLIASVAALGYRQGAIRVAFSLVGILLGALLAPPLGRLIKPLLSILGLKNPVLLWLFGPIVVFIIISAIFKIAALTVHQKIDVFYKYKTGDLRLVLWERLNHRLGLCLGLVNGVAYLILIAFLAYALSYWTYQISSPDNDPKSIRLLNRLGSDMYATGFAKVATAVDGINPAYYDAADVAGLIYNNSLLEARLSRYPAFLGLAERPEFQDMGHDKDFSEMRQRRDPIGNVLNHPKTQAVVDNPDLLRAVWAALIPDVKDLRSFLETGKSAKYDDEKILGRWVFDLSSAVVLVRHARPNLPASDMQKLKKWMLLMFNTTSVVAMTDHSLLVKNLPRGTNPNDRQTVQGQWKSADGKYLLSLSDGKGEVTATVETDRLSMILGNQELAFVRED